MPLATLGNPREGSFFGKISGFTSVSACSVVCEVLAFFAELVIPATSKARRRDSLLRLDEDKNTLKLAQYFDGLQLSMFSRHFPYADDKVSPYWVLYTTRVSLETNNLRSERAFNSA